MSIFRKRKPTPVPPVVIASDTPIWDTLLVSTYPQIAHLWMGATA